MRNKNADFNTFGGEKLGFRGPDHVAFSNYAGLSPLGTQRSATTTPPFRTLNVELLLIRPLWGRNVRQTCAVLNGILHGPPLNASALMVPKTDIRLLQEGKIPSKVLKSTFCFGFKKYSHYLCHNNNTIIN